MQHYVDIWSMRDFFRGIAVSIGVREARLPSDLRKCIAPDTVDRLLIEALG